MAEGTSAPEHAWKVGDLCQFWTGMITRVLAVKKGDPTKGKFSAQHFDRLKIIQAVPLFGESCRKEGKWVLARRCKHIDLVTLGTEYVRLGEFIIDEAKRGGMET